MKLLLTPRWLGFSEKTPQFSCRFALRALPASGGNYDLLAWWPGERAAEDTRRLPISFDRRRR
jgi:hypothetical protein